MQSMPIKAFNSNFATFEFFTHLLQEDFLFL
jgi:hypothetical protein